MPLKPFLQPLAFALWMVTAGGFSSLGGHGSVRHTVGELHCQQQQHCSNVKRYISNKNDTSNTSNTSNISSSSSNISQAQSANCIKWLCIAIVAPLADISLKYIYSIYTYISDICWASWGISALSEKETTWEKWKSRERVTAISGKRQSCTQTNLWVKFTNTDSYVTVRNG